MGTRSLRTRLGHVLFGGVFLAAGLVFLGIMAASAIDVIRLRLQPPIRSHVVRTEIVPAGLGRGGFDLVIHHQQPGRSEKAWATLHRPAYRDLVLVQRTLPPGTVVIGRRPSANAPEILDVGEPGWLFLPWLGALALLPLAFVIVGARAAWHAVTGPEPHAHPSTQTPAWLLAAGGTVLLTLGIVAVTAIGVRPLRDWMRSRDWVATPATIEMSRAVVSSTPKGGRSWHPEVLYRYPWKGENHKSSHIGNGPGGSESATQRYVAEHPQGSIATCWVNPADPTEATLHRSLSWWTLVALPLGLFPWVGGMLVRAGWRARHDARPGRRFAPVHLRIHPGTSATLGLVVAWLACPHAIHADPPRPRPGWQIALVAEAPVIRHPSVVACAPDGRVFVAEDPMDITRPAHVAEGRILCRHADGRWTVFADGLHAVFGMQYLEGRLYVLHNPRFSSFKDDHGVGRDREELVDQTHPNPWALDWNDHVPANFRLGLDGFFHVAVGDKGLFKARGRDGRVVSLHGGGMVRIRPDGSGLEVHASGVRNILDVAGTAEDEWFTYDNTDEHAWMGRLTHMIDGGFYGYPFDFIPRRPYTLWMMADFGAGAATGIACALGDALPTDHHGNLFLADFGQRNVRRVVIERQGATFRAVHNENLLDDSPPDFRPVGIAFNDDNSALYVCDWQHRDTKDQAVAGRLWKLGRAAPGATHPIPPWHVAHGLGQPVQPPDAELLAALSHPVRAVRISAQRLLSRQGHRVVPALATVLANARLGALARIHALWALDAIDGGGPALETIANAARSADMAVARQALRQLGQRRHAKARPAAEVAVAQPIDPSVRLHAAIALGRVGDARSVPPLLEALDASDLFLRHATFQALRQVGLRHPDAWSPIAAALGHSSARVRENVVHAFRNAHSPALARALSAIAMDASQSVAMRSEALRALAPLHHQEPEWNGEWWAYHPFRLEPPARTVPWAGTPDVLRVLAAASKDPSPVLRSIAAEMAGGLPVADGSGLLLSWLPMEAEPGVRTLLLQSIARMRPPAASETVVDMLRHSRPGMALGEDAVALARAVGGTQVHEALMALLPGQPGDPRIPDVIGLLAEARVTNAVPALVAALESTDPAVRRAALLAAQQGRWRSAVPALLRLASQGGEEAGPARAALLGIPDARAGTIYLEVLGGRDARARVLARQALGSVRDACWPVVEPRLGGATPEVIGEMQRIYRGHPAAIAAGLMQRPAPPSDPSALLEAALQARGNVEHGRALFRDPAGLGCLPCHRVQGEGGGIGPDLSGIGAQLDVRALAEAILWPSKSVREGYDVVRLELGDEESLLGMVRSETPAEMVVQPATGEPVRVPKERVRGRSSLGRSLMPDGLVDGLTPEHLADLLAYLASLRSGS